MCVMDIPLNAEVRCTNGAGENEYCIRTISNCTASLVKASVTLESFVWALAEPPRGTAW